MTSSPSSENTPNQSSADALHNVDFINDGDLPGGLIDVKTSDLSFVLVHGGGHGGWCWERVKEKLEGQGYNVYAPSLSGLADRASELSQDTDLQQHIQDIVDVINDNDLKHVILVGHSYGGMVITGAADAVSNRILHIVYLDAVHPKNGQSLVDAQPLILKAPWASCPVDQNGVEVVLIPDETTIRFLGLEKPEDIEFVKKHLTPHPWKSFTQKLSLTNEHLTQNIPRTDIYSPTTLNAEDPLQKKRQKQCDRLWVINNHGHDLMITEAETVFLLLEKIALLKNPKK